MMRRRILATLAFSPLFLAAQEPVLFAQHFQLQFQQLQASQATTSTTRGVYDFAFGAPVMSYRLGALALTGALAYDRQTIGDASSSASDSAFGLSSAGIHFNLFPYQPFKVRLDYTRTNVPGLWGFSPVHGDTYNVGVGYRGRYIQDVDLSLQKSTLQQNAAKDSWSTLAFTGHQFIRSTEVSLAAQRQEYESAGLTQTWRNSQAILRTDTKFSPDWNLRSIEQVESYGSTRWMDGTATLQGRSGPWTSLSTLGYRSTHSGGYDTDATSAGQSLAWGREGWNLAGSVSLSRMQDSLGQNSQSGSFIAGINASLGAGWSVLGSAATTSTSGTFITAPGSRGSTSFQIGLVRGGDLPDLIRHSLFLVSDWSFERNRHEAYPPGYLPSELADQLVQRRLQQQGTLAFALDLGRTSDKEGSGVLNWARVTGNLTAGPSFKMLAIGDLRQDDGFSQAGIRTTSRSFTGNASYSMSKVTLTATLGLTRNEQDASPTGGPLPASLASLATAPGTTRFEAAGLSLCLWGTPAGAAWYRLDPGVGPWSESLSTHVDLSFRQISLRLYVIEGRQEGGLRNHQVMVTLHRFFDTVALW